MFLDTIFLRTFGLLKVPMIFYASPSVLELTEKRAVVKVPLSYRTKNHLGSMYFGALCVGADCAGGIMAIKLVKPYGKRASVSFKDFQADFLKRPTGAVHFICEDGEKISELVKRVAGLGQRENLPIAVTAIVPQNAGEVVARFTLTLSLKINSL